ncbi:MAG: M24 family metallopeptidase [Thermomicrobiales bacterium]
MAQRIPDVRAQMQQRGLDALLITHPSNRFYLSGFTASDIAPNESAGCLLITGEQSFLIVSGTNENQARAQATGYQIVRRGRRLEETLAELLRDASVQRLGFEENALLVATYRALEQETGGAVEFVPVGELVSDLRLVKSEDELAKIARAVAITDAAFTAVARAMRPDQTERAVAWALERAMREGGAEALAFPVIVAAGAHGAFAHHEPTNDPVGTGLPITIDMGAQVDGYAADLTRTVILGEPTARARTVYQTVLRAVEAAEHGIRAGMTGEAADALARDVIGAAGYGEYFGHGLGHGVGVRVHEAPSAAAGVETPLPAGATLTIEPGIYIPDWGGVRIEDLVVVEETGVRVLSQAPKQTV